MSGPLGIGQVLNRVAKAKEGTEIMEKYYGGSGTRLLSIHLNEKEAMLNDTAKSYEVNYGYDTVANGHASQIIVCPGEAALLWDKGSPRDFAIWYVGSKEEVSRHAKKVKNLSEMHD